MKKKRSMIISGLIIAILIIASIPIIGFIGIIKEVEGKPEAQSVLVTTVASTTQTITQLTDTTILALKMVEGATEPPFVILNSEGQAVFTLYEDGSAKFGVNSVTIDASSETVTAKEVQTEEKTVTKELKVEEKLEAKTLKVTEKAEAKELLVEEKIDAKNLKITEKMEARELKIEQKMEAQELKILAKMEAQELKIEQKMEAQELSILGTTTLADLVATSISTNTLSTVGNLYVGGDLEVAGTSNLADVNAAAISASSLSTTGNVEIGGTLNVVGEINLADVNLGVLSADSLSTTGNAEIGGTLNVAGDTTLAGVNTAALIATSLSTTGNAQVDGNLNVDGDANIAGYATIGSPSADGQLEVFGHVSILGKLKTTYETQITTLEGKVAASNGLFAVGDDDVFVVCGEAGPFGDIYYIETGSYLSTILLYFASPTRLVNGAGTGPSGYSPLNLGASDINFNEGDTVILQQTSTYEWRLVETNVQNVQITLPKGKVAGSYGLFAVGDDDVFIVYGEAGGSSYGAIQYIETRPSLTTILLYFASPTTLEDNAGPVISGFTPMELGADDINFNEGEMAVLQLQGGLWFLVDVW